MDILGIRYIGKITVFLITSLLLSFDVGKTEGSHLIPFLKMLVVNWPWEEVEDLDGVDGYGLSVTKVAVSWYVTKSTSNSEISPQLIKHIHGSTVPTINNYVACLFMIFHIVNQDT